MAKRVRGSDRSVHRMIAMTDSRPKRLRNSTTRKACAPSSAASRIVMFWMPVIRTVASA